MSLSPAGLSFCLCARVDGCRIRRILNLSAYTTHDFREGLQMFIFFFILCVSVCGLHWVISRVLLSCVPLLYRETNGGELNNNPEQEKKRME
jgi:hypothetical protein